MAENDARFEELKARTKAFVGKLKQQLEDSTREKAQLGAELKAAQAAVVSAERGASEAKEETSRVTAESKPFSRTVVRVRGTISPPSLFFY